MSEDVEDRLIEAFLKKERQWHQTKNQYLKKILSEDMAALMSDIKHMRGDDKKVRLPAG